MMSASYCRFRQTTTLIISAAAILLFNAVPAHALTEAQQEAAIANLQSAVAALQTKVNSQQTTISALTAKLQYVTANGHELTLTGNLHVVSGVGNTNSTPNGLGNVIIGYNEMRTGAGAVNKRTGSHCLILGSQNNYSSYGGIVAGFGNTIGAGYANVTGGFNNTASATYSSVTGGYLGTASGTYSSVTGGYGNKAAGSYASNTGGRANVATGAWSSIEGGFGNTASATYASVGGGNGFVANAAFAFLPTSASAASLQTFQNELNSLQTNVTAQSKVTGLFSISTDPSRSDHKANTEVTMTGVNLHIVNGLGATNGEPLNVDDTANGVVNGLGNLIVGYNEIIGGGIDVRTGSHNIILGDEESYSSYGGLMVGKRNVNTAPFAFVCGSENTVSGLESSVTGGVSNNATGSCSSISGGALNTASGFTSTVSGGQRNTASGSGASVSGGFNLTQMNDQGWSAGNLHSP